MATNKYAAFYAAYNTSVKRGNPNSKEDTVKDFTDGRTVKLTDLSIHELQELVRRLNTLAGTNKPVDNSKADTMRKSIIAIFKSINGTTADAIAWAEKQGVRGVKKKFNSYTTGELFVLIQVAENIKKSRQTAIRKSITKL
jgi:hypothetical protein